MATTPSKRRVLGEITPKALNSPSKKAGVGALNFTPSDAARAQSPLKQISTHSPQIFQDKENALRDGANAHPQGRKRSIYEVDDAENVDRARDQQQGKPGAWKSALTAASLQTHEDHESIIDIAPTSPTERNTPTPEPEDLHQTEGLNRVKETAAAQDYSQGSTASFSNWLNFDLCASQKSEHPPPASTPSPPPVEDTKEKSRAQLLRTRLSFGIYKVKTNQTTKRSSDIISTWESSSPETPVSTSQRSTAKALTSSAESGPLRSQQVPSITLSHPNADFVSIKANLDPGRPIGKLVPGPMLLPTATSSRQVQTYDPPSSSPPRHAVVSPEQLMSPVKSRANYATPVSKRIRTAAYDDDTEFGKNEPLEDRIQRMREDERYGESDLTSSAVKGNAAKGLMDLMKGRR